MQISAQKAIDFGFVCDRNNKKINTDHSSRSSVDLTIREILLKDKKGEVKSYERVVLKPQDSAYIISEEVLHVPEGFVAYVFLKNRLSQKGFLALNTGIIDSNYDGPISTLLINMSAEDEYLTATDNRIDKAFFRVVFHRIDSNYDILPSSFKEHSYKVKEKYNAYRNYRISDLEKFPKTFLEPRVLKDQINKELTEKLSSISLTKIGLLIAFLSLIPFGRDYFFSEKFDLRDFNEYKINSEVKIKNLEEEINLLKKTINLDSINNADNPR
ncbi:hypothetical protein NGC23_16510 [Leclercia pneumoniae]|uniref:hypothetical protein n=1 Tax=Leclercia pneumoniae TaxID=2815358 RepID=UPI002DBF7935|nr:hypothetical protein [Leclercia pneumoniae]MEB7501781.1 hypothetical protein [Leclercia pneumoniae]